MSRLQDLKYQKRMEWGYILTLMIMIALVMFNKRLDSPASRVKVLDLTQNFQVETIPATRQGRPQQRPSRPEVIIPVDDSVPIEDEILEDFDYSDWMGDGSEGAVGKELAIEILPRPIAEVFPEYPEEDLKNRIQGIVTLQLYISEKGIVEEVVILENTTGSERCVAAAKKAAFKNRFSPARQKGKAIPLWIKKTYTFSTPSTQE